MKRTIIAMLTGSAMAVAALFVPQAHAGSYCEDVAIVAGAAAILRDKGFYRQSVAQSLFENAPKHGIEWFDGQDISDIVTWVYFRPHATPLEEQNLAFGLCLRHTYDI